MSFDSTAAPIDDRAVAVVGMSGRFPKAPTLERLWDNLVGGLDAVDDLGRSRPDVLALFDPVRGRPGKSYSKWGALLDDADQFDAAFFHVSPREAAMMDPQQRLLLETAFEALEDAGYADGSLPPETGVFVGAMASEYLPHLLENPDRIDPHTVTGNHTSVVSNRVSYFLDLHGPSLTVDVACSSSLAALHLAVQSLRSGECPFALVGATQAGLAAFHWVEFSRLGALSPTGRCRAFDADADGYVVGEGVGCLLLRPLADALAAGDRVLGVIRGVAVGHGGLVAGLTVPSPQSQARIFRRALADARVSADRLSYVEAHGTGTPLGDPVEVEGLTLAFRQDTARRQFCALGSIKSNIGHLESAAGMAGLLKVLLCFQHRTIPGNLHLRRPNPKIDFVETPFYLAERNRPWEADSPRYAAVHASGFGGSIAFAVLEEAPAPRLAEPAPIRPRHVLRLSARTESALRTAAAQVAHRLEQGLEDPPTDLAYTANSGRKLFEHRLSLHGASSREMLEALRGYLSDRPGATLHAGAPRRRPAMAFLFAGQGVQRHAMGRGLFDSSPTFRCALEECAAQLREEFEIDLLEGLFGGAREAVDETALSQPALFAFQYALGRLWAQWGVRPDVVLGHSLGEFTAAWAAGALEAADALRLVARRGALMQSLADDGGMLAVFADQRIVADRLATFGGGLAIAAINTRRNTVVAGSRSELDRLAAALELEGVTSHPLNVRRAFHSPQVEPILDEFQAAAAAIPSRPPTGRWITNVSGAFWPTGRAPDAEHWRSHMASPVRFEEGVRAALADGVRLFLEIGPSTVLTGMAREVVKDAGSDAVCIPSFQPGRDEWWSLCDAVCRLEAAGVSFDGRGFDRDYARRRVSFPTYPFERKRFWIGPELAQPAEPRPGDRHAAPASSPGPPIQHVVWRPVETIPTRPAPEGVWIVFVDRGDRAIPFVESLRSMGRLVAEVRRGEDFRRTAPGQWSIRAGEASDYARLLDQASALAPPAGVVFAWPLDPPSGATADALMEFVRLVQALTIFERRDLSMAVVASESVAAEEGEAPSPSAAALWGLVRTVAHEYPLWTTTGFDAPSSARIDETLARTIVTSAGGDVFALRRGGWRRRTLVPINPGARSFKSARPGAVVITGGLGAVGLAVAGELANRGYRSLVLASRGGVERDAGRRRAVLDLEASGVRVLTPTLDAADRESVARMLAEARARFGGVVGVVHAAGLLADRLLRTTTEADLESVLRPKAVAAVHLDELTRDDDLDFFLLCSSVVSLEGNVGQGGYAAANAYLDALAEARRALGRVATSIHWGPWRAGMAARGELAGAWSRLGLEPFEPSIGATIAADLAALPPANYAVVLRTSAAAPADEPAASPAGDARTITWPPGLLEARLRDIFAEVLRLPAGEIDAEAPFRDFGLDSILAEEALVVVRRELELPKLGVPVLFQHPSIRELAAHLAPMATYRASSPASEVESAGVHSPPPAVETPEPAKSRAPAIAAARGREANRDIAVIGYECRFPGARSAEEFWANLADGRVTVGPAPDDRWELLRRYYPLAPAPADARRPVGGWLAKIDQFDPYFFRMRPAEADHLDPRQRLFLEIAYQALEHAGYGGSRLAGTRTGTFVGVGTQDYALLERIALSDLNDSTAVGSAPSILASRLAYLLDLRGPCVPVDTACSSALVAVQMAMESLRRGECDYAVAGSVHLNLSAYVPTVLERMGVVSPTGVCRPFGDGADGLVPSEGVGAVALRRLDDALTSGDAIYAVLKGGAVNNDGRTNGIAAPNPDAQRAVLLDAWRDAGIDASTLSYIEAHGTGTTVGDAVEWQGIRDAFEARGAGGACRVGSVKANIGHADIAAGIAGLIKVVLAMGRGALPGTPNVGEPNRRIRWDEGPLRLVSTTEEWTGPRPLRAGVSAFGFAGANAHVVLEEPPPTPKSVPCGHPSLVVLSARTEELLRRQVRTLVARLSDRAEVSVEDVAYTLAVGRMHHPRRLAVLAENVAGLTARLERWTESPSEERVLSACAAPPACLQRAAADYITGASIDWGAVFSGRAVRSTALPPSELERMRCWVRRREDSPDPEPSSPAPIPTHAPTWTPHPDPAPPTGSIRSERYVVLGDPAAASPLSRALARAGACVETLPLDPRRAAANDASEWIWIEPERELHDLEGALRDWIHLTRALSASSARGLTVVTMGGEAVLSSTDVRSPTAAGLRAAARVFAREQAGRGVRSFDVDALGETEADLLTRVLAAKSNSNASLALRAGGLYRLELNPIGGFDAEPLRRGAVCLVTGALGGLGARLVRRLASRYSSRMLLLGRRPASDARALRRELRSLGAVSLYAQVDLTNVEEVRRAVELARVNFGRVEAVFHLAGVGEHARLDELTEGDVHRAAGPKVLGAWNLDLATLDDPPERFVLFSSVAGLEGNVFQTVYSAASAWLDAFAAWRTAQGRATVSLDWGPWLHAGMGAEFAARDPSSALEPESALDAMFAAIVGGRTQVILARRLPNLELPAPPRPEGSDSPPALLEDLTAILAEVLDVPASRLDPRTGFLDFGMDSRLAVEFARRLESLLGRRVPATIAFDHPNLERLAEHLRAAEARPAEPQPARVEPAPRPTSTAPGPAGSPEPMAIVATAFRFPGASTPEEFWKNLLEGRDCIRDLDQCRFDVERYYDPEPGKPGRTVSRWAGLLEDIDLFDAEFFQISDREAELLDPQQRLLLETAWALLERAGRAGAAQGPNRTGVFIGASHSEYLQILWPHLREHPEAMDIYVSTGNNLGLLANRLSFQLNLSGPSATIDTACSSSLVAVCQAIEALRNGSCDAAMAGGVNLLLTPEHFIAASRGGMLAADGRCKTFDQRADGYVRSEGVGLVLLRRLSDALADGDQILAVIRAAAVNHDGRTAGLTAPSGPAQTRLLLDAWRAGGVEPATIGYIEAHGTGTALGDPIEVQAIDEALRASGVGRQSVALGAVKSSIGHLEAAAGVASLIKTVLCVQNRAIPPTLHVREPNAHVAFERTRLYINDRARPWATRGPLRAGVSAFGMGGANAHVVVESAPEAAPTPRSNGPSLFVLSARTPSALRRLAGATAARLRPESGWNLADVCFTAAVGRTHFAQRIALYVESIGELSRRLGRYAEGDDAVVWTAASAAAAGGAWSELARRYLAGEEIDWPEAFRASGGRRVELPTYPFERRRFWIPASFRARDENLLYEVAWRPSPLPDHRRPTPWGRWLVLDDDPDRGRSVADAIRDAGGRAESSPSADEVPSDLAGVVWIAKSAESSGSEAIQAVWDVQSIVSLARRIPRPAAGPFEVCVAVASSQAQPGLDPRAEAVRTLVAAASRELPTVRWRCVAYDGSSAANLPRTLAMELSARADRVGVGYFGGRRCVPTVAAVETPPAGASLPENVCVLIVGGFGDLGFALASRLAGPERKIALAGLQGLSGDRLTKIQRLSATGSEVLALQGDVGESRDVERWRREIGERFGRLDCIVHAAGDTRADKLEAVSKEGVASAFHARARGAENLLRFAAGATTVVFFSSASALEPGPGQGVYAASSAFLDALARRAAGQGGPKVVSIGWGPWEGTRAAESEEYQRFRRAEGVLPLTLEEATSAFESLVAGERSHCAVLKLTAERRKKLLDSEGPSPPPESLDAPPDAAPTPAVEDDLRRVVRRVVAEILHVKEARVAPGTAFRDLGLDSIMAMELCGRLKRELGLASLSPTVVFEHSSVDALAGCLASRGVSTPSQAVAALPAEPARGDDSRCVAVVGIAARFPGAENLDEFWRVLIQGRETVGPIPPERLRLARSIRPLPARIDERGGFLEDVDAFDPLFFQISGREARAMDPRQRLFLQTAYHALEDAGYGGDRLAGSRTGVYVAAGPSEYRSLGAERPDEFWATACSSATLASRIAYFLNLRGPCLPVDTACSSSLVAVHLAMQAIRAGEIDAALVGGVHLNLGLTNFEAFRQMGALAGDGHCRPFGDAASGFVPGEGVAALLLKPLHRAIEDGDSIRAVLLGAAMNNDGRSNGLTAPNLLAQRDVLLAAWKDAGVEASDVDFLECHGTGTPLGDPVELQAVDRTVRGRRTQRLLVGSVKSNIGHAEAAAGLAGLAKAILAIEHKRIPPTLYAAPRNRHFDWENSVVDVSDQAEDWPAREGRRIAGVSAFGFSGTNVHVVVAEAPAAAKRSARSADSPVVLALSARTPEALSELRTTWGRWLLGAGRSESLADIAATAALGRFHLRRRVAVWGASHEEWARGLTECGAENVVEGVASGEGPRVEAALSAEAFARAYAAGAAVDWREKWPKGAARQVSAPVYPFARERYWLSPSEEADEEVHGKEGAPSRDAPGVRGERIGAALDAALRHVASSRESELDKFQRYLHAADEFAVCAFAALIAAPPAFGRVGDRVKFEDIAHRLRVAPFYLPWLRNALDRLVAAGFLAETGEEFTLLRLAASDANPSRLAGDFPGAQGLTELLQGFGSRLGDVLRGECDPLSLLFPDGRMDLANAAHAENAVVLSFARLAAAAIQSVLDATPAGRSLRVLEVGGGAGGLARRMLEGLPADRIEYVLTDVSAELCRRAEVALASCPGLSECRPFDLERPPAAQGFAEGRFDVIVATNVVHATRDVEGSLGRLASLLAPGGALLLTELVESRPWLELTFGLTKGWWAFEDRTVRRRGPLLSESAWKSALGRVGLRLSATAPAESERLASFGQRLFIAARAEAPAPAATKKQPPRRGAEPSVDSLLYETRWTASPIRSAPRRRLTGNWVVFAPPGPFGPLLAATMTERGAQVSVCHPGTRFGSAGEAWTIHADSAADYERLLTEATSDRRLAGVVHLWSYGEPAAGRTLPETIFELDERVALGPRSLFLLAAALARRASGHHRTRILAATTSGSLAPPASAVRPDRAALAAILRSVASEEPGLTCRCVDLEGADAAGDAARIVEELVDEDPAVECAYRAGARLAPELRRLDFVRVDRRALGLRKGGCYLITGGLGGIGLELARRLARRYQARLILTGTRPLPTGDAASGPLAGRLMDGATRAKLEAIAEIRQCSGDVLVRAANAADLESMSAAFTEGIARFGRIDGVFHLAGRLRDGRVSRQGLAEFEAVWQPKGVGAWVLDRLTRLYPPDWLVFFSSVASTLGGPGQAAYAGANRHLDALAAVRSREGLPTVSISWGLWANVGMGREIGESAEAARALAAMPPELALEAVPRALELDVEVVTAARFGRRAESAPAPAAPHDPPTAPASLEEISQDVLRRLARLLEIPIEQIDPNEPLVHLGLDSIQAARLTRELEAQHGRGLAVTVLRDNPSVSAISEYLHRTSPGGA